MNSEAHNMDQHINEETLSNYVKTVFHYDDASPENFAMESKLYNQVIDHLASCNLCREQVTAISTVLGSHQYIHQKSSLTSSQQKMICDFIDGNLAAEESASVKKLITNDDDAMKAALHYQSHSETMAQDLSRNNAFTEKTPLNTTIDTTTRKSNKSFLKQAAALIEQFFNTKPPLIYTITATAALLLAIALTLNTVAVDQQQTMIASYQDDPTIQFTEKNKLPGIGFFAQSGNISKPFEDIKIELVSENTIRISWPKVDGATLYNMRIQVFNRDRKSVLQEISTRDNYTAFKLDIENSNNRRYEWILYGNTVDERMFYASGGFIVNNGY